MVSSSQGFQPIIVVDGVPTQQRCQGIALFPLLVVVLPLFPPSPRRLPFVSTSLPGFPLPRVVFLLIVVISPVLVVSSFSAWVLLVIVAVVFPLSLLLLLLCFPFSALFSAPPGLAPAPPAPAPPPRLAPLPPPRLALPGPPLLVSRLCLLLVLSLLVVSRLFRLLVASRLVRHLASGSSSRRLAPGSSSGSSALFRHPLDSPIVIVLSPLASSSSCLSSPHPRCHLMDVENEPRQVVARVS